MGVHDEKEVSQDMLDNMLPPYVTERLAKSATGQAIADSEPQVTAA
jgi:hypothetical protein